MSVTSSKKNIDIDIKKWWVGCLDPPSDGQSDGQLDSTISFGLPKSPWLMVGTSRRGRRRIPSGLEVKS